MSTPNNGGNSSGTNKMLRRYGPIALVVVVIVGVIVGVSVLGGGDDDDSDVAATENGDGNGGSDLPVIFQEAEAEGRADEIDWGDGCDTELGRLKIPIADAAPCIEPFEEGADNGGATAQGVTEDEIVIALYQGEPDPLAQAIVEGAGADTDPADVNQTAQDYLRLFEDVYETYGRTFRIETIVASGQGNDSTAAIADAQKVIDLKPFAAVGGPAQTPAYWQELVNAGIVCVGGCSLAEPWDVTEDSAPYLWPTGPNPEQADSHLLELVGKQLVDKPVSFAGDEALNGQDRVFGWIQAETETGEYDDRTAAFDQALSDEYGAEVATRFNYIFDPARAAEVASGAIQRMKEAGVTTVILSTDPLIPADITKEATAQNYFPEWVLGPSVLMDTTIFGRLNDQQQWSNMVGIALPAARAERELGDSYIVYDWYYGTPPGVNSQAAIMPGPHTLALGVHLAGPNLTPETFKAGLFRYPAGPTALTSTRESWGTETWDRDDYNGADDAGAMWWNPTATGESETGEEGTGMLAYVEGGKRYLPGEWPTEPIPFFEEEGSVTIYDARPDAPPEYPPWPGSPGAG
jgi:hypothetical protein